MVLQEICAPALIYLIFSMTQVVIDTVKGSFNIAFIKLWVTLIFTILLNFLCSQGLGIVSWIIVFIPFILMTVIVTLILLAFGLDPITGRKIRMSEDHGMKHHHRRKRAPGYLPTKHHHSKRRGGAEYAHDFNSGRDESHTSPDTKQALEDAVTKRTDLNNDPLQN